MGATAWEIDLARKNGVNIVLWSTPRAINGNRSVNSVSMQATTLLEGRLQGGDTSYELPATSVLKAVGQTFSLPEEPALALAEGNIIVNQRFETNLPGVFAGGDCIDSGEDLTVQAVEHGKRAAHAMGRYLFTIQAVEVECE